MANRLHINFAESSFFGLWKSKMAEAVEEQRLKWNAALFFIDEGKIAHMAEGYDTEDLTRPYEGD